MTTATTSNQKQKSAEKKESNIKHILSKIKDGIKKGVILKIKGHIIHSWMNDFEDQYLKTFKVVVETSVDPKEVMRSVYNRMKEMDYNSTSMIIVKYAEESKFSVLSSYTPDEKELAEFQKWKRQHGSSKEKKQ